MDVLPNPATRVQLLALAQDPTSTYINANYVRGWDGRPAQYICTQGALIIYFISYVVLNIDR
jgi:protein tyrosine phosphatase